MKRWSKLLVALILLAGVSTIDAEVQVEKVFVTGPRSSSCSFEVSSHGQLFATVEVSGRKLKMLIDTGGANTSIDRGVADELGIKPEGEERTIALGGGVATDHSAHADIMVAELLVHRTPIRLLDLSATRKSIKETGFDDFEGVLGVDLLLFLRAKVDFGHRTLQLYRP